MSVSTVIVGEYYRSWKGDVIHLAPCKHMGRKAVSWTFADGMSLHDVVYLVREGSSGLRLCRSCWPRDAVATAGGSR